MGNSVRLIIVLTRYNTLPQYYLYLHSREEYCELIRVILGSLLILHKGLKYLNKLLLKGGIYPNNTVFLIYYVFICLLD
jgi:hypothetical protein